MRHPAGGDALDRTLLPPRLEVLHLRNRPRVLDPLDHLRHGYEVDVIVLLQYLVHPVEESVQELGVVLEPSGVEVESQGRAVLVVVSVEVVVQEVVELVSSEDVGAGVHHGAPWEVLVEVGVLPAVELVHDHLPDGVAPGGTMLQVAVAPVRHAEVHGVRPEGRVTERCRDGGVVQERLLLHHRELVVAADPQVGSSHSDHAVVGQVSVLLSDNSHPSHFLSPVIDGSVAPELFFVIVSATPVTMNDNTNRD